MRSPSELTLDCKPHSYSMLLKSFGEHNNNNNDHTLKLEEFLSRLEQERQKIDVFKRELPLCMQLLTNAVETSRQQLQAYRGNQGGRPILEEFIPLNNDKSDNKVNWMTTAQLWTQPQPQPQPQSTLTNDNNNNNNNNIGGFSVSPKLCLDTKQRNGGAFLPFSKEKEKNLCPAPTTLALSSPDKQIMGAESDKGEQPNSSPDHGQTTNNNTTSTHRKARRCWSPDLHRRFVNALQMLGGSQVATPKQIRELMKVEGLTNDEVKSHLQKYRLHTRRPSPSPQAASAPAPQLVVLGGIWVPPEYATSYHPAPPPHFLPHPHPHPQDFYTPPQPLHLHHQLHMYKATSQPHTSPERSESIEDGKSESSSWKAENVDRKGLGPLRELDAHEETNASQITLKF
ncbi:myb family transcription factor EFM [Euphorbia lathyris]|uniref:myb family transcription factor EFM n=1 Tax=Euphorbia lathyris TaxID=212925 RepID=UPI0033144306